MLGGRDSRVPATDSNMSSLGMPEGSRRDGFQDGEINRKSDVNESIEKASNNWQRV